MKNIQNLVIDINKKPFQNITANVGEVGSRFVRITILDNNVPINLTGVSVFIYAKKPDDKKVFNNVTIENVKQGIVLAELTSQILAAEGLVKLTLLLVKDSGKLCSKQFLLNVDKTIVDDNAIESKNEFTALTKGLADLAEYDTYKNNVLKHDENLIKHEDRLNEVDSQLEHIVQYIEPENFGYNYNENTTSKMQECLQSGKNIRLKPNKIYKINDTLDICDNSILYCENGEATIQITTPDKPILTIKKLSSLKNVKLVLASNNTIDEGCGIKILLSDFDGRVNLENVAIYGNDKTGIGIFIEGNDGNQSFSNLSNIYMEQLKCSMKANVISPGYATGFKVDKLTVRRTTKLFDFTGFSANTFTNLQWNQDSSTDGVMNINSYGNNINGHFYDIGGYGSTDLFATFDSGAENNIITTTQSNLKIIDNSKNKLNFLNINKEELLKILNKILNIPATQASNEIINEDGYWSRYIPYNGHVDNILAFADKIHAVTSNKTLDLANIFNPFALDLHKPSISLSEDEEVYFEITLNEEYCRINNKRLDYFKIIFDPYAFAKKCKLEVFENSTWKEVGVIEDNKLNYYVIHGNRIGNEISTNPLKLRIVLAKPSNETNIKILQIHARMLTSTGLSYMHKNGGKVYGDIEFSNPSDGAILKSPSGYKYKLKIDDSGMLSAIKL